jgi:hypothetical protein
MRKRLITPTPETIRIRGGGWLDIERAAAVEITLHSPALPRATLANPQGTPAQWNCCSISGPTTLTDTTDQNECLVRH